MPIAYAGDDSAPRSRGPRSDKRLFAGSIKDNGYSYGEALGYLRQTISHILLEHPGCEPEEIHLRFVIEEDEDHRPYALWHWSVRIA